MARQISIDPLVAITIHSPIALRQAVVAGAAISGKSLSAFVNDALRAHFARAGAVV